MRMLRQVASSQIGGLEGSAQKYTRVKKRRVKKAKGTAFCSQEIAIGLSEPKSTANAGTKM